MATTFSPVCTPVQRDGTAVGRANRDSAKVRLPLTRTLLGNHYCELPRFPGIRDNRAQWDRGLGTRAFPPSSIEAIIPGFSLLLAVRERYFDGEHAASRIGAGRDAGDTSRILGRIILHLQRKRLPQANQVEGVFRHTECRLD